MNPLATDYSPTADTFSFLPGHSEIARHIRNGCCNGGPLGNPEQWPGLLRSTVGTLLHSPLPMLLLWGTQKVCLYNDALALLLTGGTTPHPWLGQALPDTCDNISQPWAGPLEAIIGGGKSHNLDTLLARMAGYSPHASASWTLTGSPLNDETGRTQGVLAIATEKAVKAAKFRNLIEQTKTPVLMLTGPDLVIDEANEATLRLWQLDRSVMGRPLALVLPEMEAQGFVALLQQVYRTGETYMGVEVPAYFDRPDGTREAFYWNFEHSAYREDDGTVSGVLALAYDVTTQVIAKRQLKESEDRYQQAIEGGGLGTYDYHLQTDTLYWSERTKQLFGLPPDAVVGYNDFIRGMHPDDVAGSEAAAAAAMDPACGRYDYEYRTIGQTDKQLRWVRSKGRVVFEGDTPIRLSGVVQDITRQKETEAALFQARIAAEKLQRLYETITGSTPDLIYVFGLDYRFTYANKALLDMWGLSWEEAKGKGMTELGYEPWHAEMHMREIDQVVATQQPVRGEVSFPHATLGRRVYDYIFVPVPGPNGTVEAVAGTTRDITELKEVEEKIKASEERFRTLANEAPAFIFMGDADAQLDFVSRSWLEFTGLTEAEAKGQAWASVTHPDDVAISYATYNEGFTTRSSYQYEVRQLCAADGSYHWVLWRGVPRFLPGGAFAGMMGIGMDITENKRANEALQQSEARYRQLAETLQQLTIQQNNTVAQLEALLQHAPVGFTFFDRQLRYMRLNQQVADMNGLPIAAHIGKPIAEVVPDLAAPVNKMLEQVMQTRQPIANIELQGETLKEPGVTRYWLTSYYPVLAEHSEEVVAAGIVVLEITDRRLAEQKLRESEKRFRILADALPQMIWMSDREGKVEYASSHWFSYSGITDIQGAWNAILHPDDRGFIHERWAESLQKGIGFSSEVRLKNSAGEYRWHNTVSEPVYDDAGNIVNWVGALTDIQVQKSFSENLEQLVEQRTRELQRSNEDLQQFAHVASHDLKEPVRKIRTFTSMLQGNFNDELPERARLYLSKIDSAAGRMYAMIDGVLLYASVDALDQKTEEVDLNRVLQLITDDLELLITQKEARISYTQLLPVKGSQVLMYQLLYNLLSNSLKFTRPGVAPLIHITTAPYTDVASGLHYVKIVVSDNGLGFHPDEAGRIFKTFTRLFPKDQFEGTGLGLSLCRKIVERHKGSIWAEGRPGAGASFTLLLPV